MGEAQPKIEVTDQLSDKTWRMNNLYNIIDKSGKKIKFIMNDSQEKFFEDMWYLNIILKARQRGFTTFIDIFILDECLFNSNIEAGIIAHTKNDAIEIFRRKVKFPYDNLPESIKDRRKLTTDAKNQLAFPNGSVLTVGTSMRSGTIQYLHISEFGKICAKYPDKAREIVTGSLETVAKGQMVFIESTAEGKLGYFHDYSMLAYNMMLSGNKLTELDYKLFFSPWYVDPDYTLDPHSTVIPQKLQEYFDELSENTEIVLDDRQKAWYAKKWQTLGSDIKREYPATVEEAFDASIEGAYFAAQMALVREEKRITTVPAIRTRLVDTWWDLGMNDTNAIWFTQTQGSRVNVIDYYENNGEGFDHYYDVLQDKAQELGYRYGTHTGPHDLKVRELGAIGGKSRWASAAQLGLRFKIVPRVKKKADSIQAARNLINQCWFDEEKCSTGIDRLDNYRKEWNERLGVYRDKPLHDENSNGADAFQTLAMGYGKTDSLQGAPQPPKPQQYPWA
jgi:hypothetical protein